MKHRKVDLGRALAWTIDNVVFVIAAVVLFLKTSEVLTAFAPGTVLGYSSHTAQVIYGVLCALLIEGLLVAAKYTLAQNANDLAWLYNIVLLLVTFAISAGAQVIDGQLVRNELDRQQPIVQDLVNVGVPLIPSIVLLLAIGKEIFETVPQSVIDGISKPKRRGAIIVTKDNHKALPTPDNTFQADTEMADLALTEEDKQFIAAASMTKIRERYRLKWRDAIELKHRSNDGKL